MSSSSTNSSASNVRRRSTLAPMVPRAPGFSSSTSSQTFANWVRTANSNVADRFPGAHYNDLMLYTQHPSSQRILVGTDASQPATIALDTSGVRIAGVTDIAGTLRVSGTLQLPKGFSIQTGLSVGGDAVVKDALTVNNAADETLFHVNNGGAHITRPLTLDGDLLLSGVVASPELRVNDLSVRGDLSVMPRFHAGDTTRVLSVEEHGNVTVEGGALLRATDGAFVAASSSWPNNNTDGSALHVAGDVVVSTASADASNLVMAVTDAHGASVHRDLSVLGGHDVDILDGGDLFVSSNATVGGQLTAGGGQFRVTNSDFDVSCNATFASNVAIGGSFSAAGSADVNGKLNVTGTASFSSGLDVYAPFRVNAPTLGSPPLASVTQQAFQTWVPAHFWGDELTVRSGGALAPTLLRVSGSNDSVAMDAHVAVNKDLVVASNAVVGGELSVDSNMDVVGHVTCHEDVDVGRDLHVLGDAFMEGGGFVVRRGVVPAAGESNNAVIDDGGVQFTRDVALTDGAGLDVVAGDVQVGGGVNIDGSSGLSVRRGAIVAERDQILASSNMTTPAAPGFAWTGDEDTGVYHPGPNALAFATDGQRRLVIESNGDVDVAGALRAASIATSDGGGLSNLNASLVTTGVLGVAQGGTGRRTLDAGSLLVAAPPASSSSSSCNAPPVETPAALKWDDAHDRLGVGLASNEPIAYTIHAGGDVAADDGGRFLADDALTIAAFPTYSWIDDSNTGMYRPEEDTVGIATGGYERARFSSNGDVGIGTAAPKARLHVAGGDLWLEGRLTHGSMSTDRLTTGTLAVPRGGTGTPYINADKLVVGGGAGPVGAPNALHWDSCNDRLGVGTTLPASTLDVAGTTTSRFFVGDGSGLCNLDVGSAVATGALAATHGGTGRAGLKANRVLVGAGVSNPDVAQPADLTWDLASQRLGLRTSAPRSALDVAGTATADFFVGDGSSLCNLDADSVTSGQLAVAHGGTGTAVLTSNKLVVGRGSNAPALTPAALHWDAASDRLGIGTAAPRHALDVSGTAIAHFFEGDGSGLCNLNLGAVGLGVLSIDHGGTGRSSLVQDKLIVGRGSQAVAQPNALHWDGYAQRLGVGTTAPRTLLDVGGTATADFFRGDGSGLCNLDTNSVGSGTLAVAHGGTGTALLSSNKLVVGQGSNAAALTPPDLHWDVANRRLGVGTSAPTDTVDVAGTVRATAFVGDGSSITGVDASNVTTGRLEVARGGTGNSGLTRDKVLVGRGPVDPVLQPTLLHWDASNDRLGVGTDVPQHALDVVGTARADFLAGDGGRVSNLNMNAAGFGDLSVARGGTGRSGLTASKLVVGQGSNTPAATPADLHWDAGTARLGIGTTAPVGKLDVSGTARATAFAGDGSALTGLDVGSNSVATGTLAVSHGGTGAAGLTDHKLVVGAGPSGPVRQPQNLHWDDSNNRLGVGTVAPRDRLDVAGTVRATDFRGGGLGISTLDMAAAAGSNALDVTHGGTGDVALTANKVLVGSGTAPVLQPAALHWDAAQDRLGIGTSAPETALHVQAGDVLVGGGGVFYGDGSGLCNLDVDGVGGGVLAVPHGGTGASNHAAKKVLVGDGSNPIASPVALHWDDGSNFLGVGTSAPVSELDVFGTATAHFFVGDGAGLCNLNVGAANVGGGVLAVQHGGTGASNLKVDKVMVGRGGAAGTSVLTPGDLHWDSASNRLGVRTAAPQHALDVRGSVRAALTGSTSNANAQMLGDANDSAGSPAFSWDGDSDTGAFRPSANAMAFATGGTERVRFTDTGRVGIGTSAPRAQLHVAGGDVWLDGRLIHGGMSTDRLDAGVLPVARGGTGSGSHQANKLLFGDGASALRSATALHFDASNAYLGVGTSAPRRTVDVAGTVRAYGLEGDGIGISNLNVSAAGGGTLAVAHGGTGTDTLVASKLMVGSGANAAVVTPAQLHWDDVNKRLGVSLSNASAPKTALDVGGTVTADAFHGDGRYVTHLDAGNVDAGTLPVARGGTGAAALTDAKLLVGRGTSAVSSPADLTWNQASRRLEVGRAGAASSGPVDLKATGTVTAASFVGDGSGVTRLNMDAAQAGVLNVERGGTGTSNLTAGRVLVGRGGAGTAVLSASQLHWDERNGFLGVGVSTPTQAVDVRGTVLADAFRGDGAGLSNVGLNASTSGVLSVAKGGTGAPRLDRYKLVVGNGTSPLQTFSNLHWDDAHAFLGVGTATPSNAVDVIGTVHATGGFVGSGANVTGLDVYNVTAGVLAVPHGGTGRASMGAQKLVVGDGSNALRTFSNLHWDDTASYLGVGKSAPTHSVDVAGDVNAVAFIGDGSALTNLNASALSGGVAPVSRGGTGASNLNGGKLLVGDGQNPVFAPSALTWNSTSNLPSGGPVGRLGIHTYSNLPRGALDVNGDVYASRFVGSIDMTSANAGVLAAARGGTGTASNLYDSIVVGSGTSPLRTFPGFRWDSSNNRLGINVSLPAAPAFALDVGGDARATSQFLAGSASNGTGTATAPSFAWYDDRDTGMFRPAPNQLELASGGTARVRLTDTGFVGINTAQPTAMLHVSGDFDLDGVMRTGSMSTDRITSGSLPVPRGGTARSNLTRSKVLVGDDASPVQTPADLHWDYAAHRLGVGTAAPRGALDVAGTVYASNFVGDASGLTGLHLSFADTTGTLDVGRGGTGTTALSSNKLVVGHGTAHVSTPAALHWDDSNLRMGIGTSTPTETLDVDGAVRASTQVLVTAGNDSATRPAYSWYGDVDTGIYRPAADALGFATAGVERARFDSLGKLGVNTSSPTATLDVNGDVSFSGTLTAGTVPATRIGTGTVAVERGGTATGKLSKSKLLVGNDYGPVRTPNLLDWDFTRNRLGVGKTGPQDTLDVGGGVIAQKFVGDGSQLTNISAGSISASTGGATIAVGSGGTGRSSLAAGRLLIGDGTSPVLTNDYLFWSTSTTSLGVGINVSTVPREKLDVGGNVLSGGGQFLVPAGVDSSNAPAFSWRGDADTGLFRPAARTLGFATNGRERVRITNSGYLGVNTAAPTAALDVSGDFALSGTMTSGSLSAARVTTGTFPVNRGGTGSNALYANKLLVGNDTAPVQTPVDLHWDASNARLGIGTTTPQYTLDVGGAVQATKFVGDASGLSNVSVGLIDVPSGGTARTSLNASKLVVGNGSNAVLTPNLLHWDNASARLGVGTATPQDTLQVAGGNALFEGDVRGATFYGNGGGLCNIPVSSLTSSGPSNVIAVDAGGTGASSFPADRLLIGDGSNAIKTNALLHWDSCNDYLGVRTSAPQYALDVSGDVRSTGGKFMGDGSSLSNLDVDNVTAGTLPVARGGTGTTSLTSSKLLVGEGTNPISAPSDLHWDATNHRLGIGTAFPTTALDVKNADSTVTAAAFVGNGNALSNLDLNKTSTVLSVPHGGTAASFLSSNRLLIGKGTAAVHAETDLYWDGSNSRLGIGTSNPQSALDVGTGGVKAQSVDVTPGGTISTCNLNATGLVSAGLLAGDGSSITNIASGNITSGFFHVDQGGTSRSNLDPQRVLVGNGSNALLSAAALRYDDSNQRLGVGNKFATTTQVPAAALHVDGDARFDSGTTVFAGDTVVHDGIVVIMDGQDGGTGRGIYLWDSNTSEMAIYASSSGFGNSVAGGPAVKGDGFGGRANRFRTYASSNNGFIFENASEQLLFSLRGADGLAHFAGAVTTSGNVGVKTASPQYDLDVQGGTVRAQKYIGTTADLQGDATVSGSVYVGTLGTGTNSNLSTPSTVFLAPGYGDAQYKFSVLECREYRPAAYNELLLFMGDERSKERIRLYSGEIRFDTFATATQGDRTVDTDNRMIITSNGDVGIGTTTPSQKLTVDGSILSTRDVISSSDRRLKTNLRALELERDDASGGGSAALARVQRLRGYRFNRLIKGGGGDANSGTDRVEVEAKDSIGFVAQEMLDVTPELVHYDAEKDEYSVNYAHAVVVLAEAMKALKREKDELGAEVADLKRLVLQHLRMQ